MTRITGLIGAMLVAGVLAAAQPGVAQSAGATPQAQVQQDHQEHHPGEPQPPLSQAQETDMAAMQQKMMAEMKAMDARLGALVTAMNAAKGDAKVEAMAEVITTLVQQRTVMRDRMMSMQTGMMGHMMQHMSAGMSPEAMKKMMSQCPLMKQMGTGGAK